MKQENTGQDRIRIAGVDPGSKTSTLCVLDFKGDVLFLNSMSNDSDRLWIAHLKRIDILFLESQYVQKNVNSAIKLAHGAGIINGFALVAGIEDIRYTTPSAWQKVLRMSKKATREQLKQRSKLFAHALFGKKVTNTDHADALNIAEFGRQQVRIEDLCSKR